MKQLATATNEEISYRQPPANIEAEQAVLGALLINNDELLKIGDFLKAEHFYEPVHQKIYAAISLFIDRGQIANPITLKQYFVNDESLKLVGGAEYLVRMAANSDLIIDIKQYANVIYDCHLKRSLIKIGEEMVVESFSDDYRKAALTMVEESEQKLFMLAESGTSGDGAISLKEALVGSLRHTEKAFRNSGEVSGITSGFIDMDRLLGGFQESDLVIIAGRPSMGKTALATNFAVNACEAYMRKPKDEQRGVGIFSLEMSAEQLGSRILAGAASLNASKLRTGQMTQDEFTRLVIASQELSNTPLYIDDTPALSISAMRTRARRMKRKHDIGMIVVDYLQLLRSSSAQAAANRVQEISEITQGLKAIAKELNIPVLALSQLSRAVEQREDKRPLLSDLRESGSIEQDADIVMFVFREEYYLERKTPREGTPEHDLWKEEMDRVIGITEVIVAKHRNGPIGTVRLGFDSDKTRFKDFTDNARLGEYYDE